MLLGRTDTSVIYLASDWRDWILEQKAYKGHSEGVTGEAGVVQAILIHHPQHGHHHRPHNVQIFPCHLWKHRFEF